MLLLLIKRETNSIDYYCFIFYAPACRRRSRAYSVSPWCYVRTCVCHIHNQSHLLGTFYASSGPGVSLTLCCFVIHSARRFVLSLTLCYFVLVFFSPFSIGITSLGKEKTNLSDFLRLFDLSLFGFVCFLFLLVSEKGCSLWFWHSLDFSLTFFFFFFFFALFMNIISSNVIKFNVLSASSSVIYHIICVKMW